ncbi:MAG TPA: hypothetical protein DCM12_04340 [Gammaproteobacteria bacterium]|nr:hypothetical protein [Gammaproteobacteria bacterium]
MSPVTSYHQQSVKPLVRFRTPISYPRGASSVPLNTSMKILTKRSPLQQHRQCLELAEKYRT